MDETESSPPWTERRATKRRRFADGYASSTKTRPPQATTVTIVAAIIGRMRVVLRTERYIYDRGISRRRVRVWGEHRDKRISVRRHCEAASAAYAYHATRRALGIGLLPLRTSEASLAIMGWAQLTTAGANSRTGQELAARMRSLGVQIADKPLEERHLGEFWWADC